jgi:hypothetical protein
MKKAFGIFILMLFFIPLIAQNKGNFTQEQLKKALVRDKTLESIGLVNIAIGSALIGIGINDFNSPSYSRNSMGQPVKNNLFEGTGKLLIGCLFAGTGIPLFITGAVKRHNVEVKLRRINVLVSSSDIGITIRF